MKKFILLTALICGFLVSNSQKTTGGNYTYIAQRYEWLAGVFKALGLPAGSGPAAFTTGQEPRAGAVYYDSLGLDAGFYIWTGTAWVLQGTAGAADLPDGLIQPGYVTYSGTGLKFYITPSLARFDGVIYATDYDSVTLTTADPDDPRKDVIYVSVSGIGVKTGVPAGPAAEPQMEAGQIKLTVVDIQAGASVPTITTNVVYDENTGESTVSVGGAVPPTFDPDNTSNVYHLTKSLNITNINHLDEVIFTLPSTIDLTTYEGISLFIRLKAIMQVGANIYISFYNGSTAISNEVKITINKNSLTYQGLTVPMSLFTLNQAFADKVTIRWYQYNLLVHSGFYMDYVHFESGVTQPGSGSAPMTVGLIGSKLPSPNGAVIENNVFYNQLWSQSNPGLGSKEDKAKLDSLKYDYFFVPVGDGEELATQVNDSTVGIKSLKAGTGVTLDVTDTTITVNSTGGVNGIDDVLALQQPFTTHRKIGANGFDFTIDSAINVNLRSGLEFISSGIGSSIQMSDSVMSLTSSSTTDFSTIQTTPTKIKFIPFDGVGSAGDVWTNLGNGEGHWAAGGGGGASIWNGAVIGTTFSATTSTVNNGAVQWTFTGSSPETFTLPARTSSVNQFYTFKNLGSATLTIAAAGTDDIYTSSAVPSVALLPNESTMITGGANGTSDLWTELFHTGISNLLIDSTDTDGPATVFASGDTLRARTMVGTGGIAINLSATGGYEIDGSGIGSSGVTLSSDWFGDTLHIGSSYTYIKRADIYDEMIGSAVSTTLGTHFHGGFGSGAGAVAGLTTSQINGNGWATLGTGTTTTGQAALYSSTTGQTRTIIDTTKAYRFETNVQLEDLSDGTETFGFHVGSAITTTTTTGTNAIWFRYQHSVNSGNWTCYSSDASTTQSTNSGVAVAADTQYKLAYEYDNGSVLFYINGTLVATHSTNKPVHNGAAPMLIFCITKSAGSTARLAYIDYSKYRKL